MRSATKTKNIKELIPEAPFYPYLPNFKMSNRRNGASFPLTLPLVAFVRRKSS
jgi:hypothetical protein